MKIVQKREYVEVVQYFLNFYYLDNRGIGFSFPCDKSGKVHVGALSPVAKENYEKCLAGKEVGRGELEEYRHHYVNPAVGLCDDCGEKIFLDRFTNACECGADYNMSGQRLAPREQWGRDTGESVEDILSVDYTDTDALLSEY